MKDIWTVLSEKKNIVLYGTGNGADKLLDELEKRNIPVKGVFASSGFVRERTFRGFAVKAYDKCKEEFPDMTVLMCFGSSRSEVLESVRKMAAECEFYFPEVPVYGNSIFDMSFYHAHENELRYVKSRLSDEESVTTFENIIKYRLSGEVKHLFKCETTLAERNSLLPHIKNAVICDLGAYTGDTVAEIAAAYPDYSCIIAVEPDNHSFKKLMNNTSKLNNIKLINAAAGEKDGELLFSSGVGRGGHTSSHGKTVNCVTLDGVLSQSRADIIKYDVEGFEKEAIKGSENTIALYKPALRVAAYHRSEDIFSLPLQVLGIRDDYKLYMRHLPSLPAWDTEFIFV